MPQDYKQHVFLRLGRNAFNMLLLTASYEAQQCQRNTLLLFCYWIAPPCYALYTRVGTLIVATIYLQLIQNRYMFRSFTVLQRSHQHCVQPVASDVEVVG